MFPQDEESVVVDEGEVFAGLGLSGSVSNGQCDVVLFFTVEARDFHAGTGFEVRSDDEGRRAYDGVFTVGGGSVCASPIDHLMVSISVFSGVAPAHGVDAGGTTVVAYDVESFGEFEISFACTVARAVGGVQAGNGLGGIIFASDTPLELGEETSATLMPVVFVDAGRRLEERVTIVRQGDGGIGTGSFVLNDGLGRRDLHAEGGFKGTVAFGNEMGDVGAVTVGEAEGIERSEMDGNTLFAQSFEESGIVGRVEFEKFGVVRNVAECVGRGAGDLGSAATVGKWSKLELESNLARHPLERNELALGEEPDSGLDAVAARDRFLSGLRGVRVGCLAVDVMKTGIDGKNAGPVSDGYIVDASNAFENGALIHETGVAARSFGEDAHDNIVVADFFWGERSVEDTNVAEDGVPAVVLQAYVLASIGKIEGEIKVERGVGGVPVTLSRHLDTNDGVAVGLELGSVLGRNLHQRFPGLIALGGVAVLGIPGDDLGEAVVELVVGRHEVQ